MPPIPDDLRQRLRQYGQEHTLGFYGRLDERRQQGLIDQLSSLDLEQLRRLFAQRGKTYAVPPAERIRPVPVIPHDSPDNAARRGRGEQALRQGKVAALLVAGGQGRPLGLD